MKKGKEKGREEEEEEEEKESQGRYGFVWIVWISMDCYGVVWICELLYGFLDSLSRVWL